MKVIINGEQYFRILKRISHEIIEKNDNLSNIVLVGIKSKGTPICKAIQENIKLFANVTIPMEEIDITKYRDDAKKRENAIVNFKTNIEGKLIILVDDVLYTGRSVRAAMDALMDLGRAGKIQLVVMVDRGHRELPIRADFVGKNIPTSNQEQVIFDLTKFEFYIK